MFRRQLLKSAGVSAASLSILSSTVVESQNNGGIEPVGGEHPNENAPEAFLNALPWGGGTREVGQFLTLRNGWAPVTPVRREKVEELLNKSRQTFTYEGETFVLDSVDDWDWEPGAGSKGGYFFSHTDPPYPKGTVVDVSWEMVMTDDFYDNQEDVQYYAGDIFRPNIFPSSSSYEIVRKAD